MSHCRPLLLALALWSAPSRAPAAEESSAVPTAAAARPSSTASPSAESEVEQVLLASQEVSFEQLLDEMFNELVSQLRQKDLRDLSPLAIRHVHLSANLAAALEQIVVIGLNTRLADIPGLSQVECAACFAVRSRIDGGQWVVTRGVVDSHELKQIGRQIRATAFLDATLEWAEADQRLSLSVRIVRGENSEILFASRIDSSETAAALGRNGRAGQSLEARRLELEAMLEGKPTFGHSAVIGLIRVPYKSPEFDGAISGISAAYRLYELFGARRANLFGLQVGGFYDPSLGLGTKGKIPAAGGLFSAVYMHSILPDDLRWPVLRAGVAAGGFLGGSIGNTALAGIVLELMMRWRLAANAAVYYVVPVSVEELNARLGGWSFQVGGAFNWE